MAKPTEPRTLRAAHEIATERLPAPDANPAVWLAFRQSNARMYEKVADVDRGHHHEALYWAGYERRKAGEVSAQIQGSKSKSE
ncbi:AMED_5909 family protein [Amycolatopsis sp. NPDC005003]